MKELKVWERFRFSINSRKFTAFVIILRYRDGCLPSEGKLLKISKDGIILNSRSSDSNKSGKSKNLGNKFYPTRLIGSRP